MTSKVLKIIIAGQEILVDRRDLMGIDLCNLRITSDGYAVVGNKLLHRLIMNPPANMQIDHINKNTLGACWTLLKFHSVFKNFINDIFKYLLNCVYFVFYYWLMPYNALAFVLFSLLS